MDPGRCATARWAMFQAALLSFVLVGAPAPARAADDPPAAKKDETKPSDPVETVTVIAPRPISAASSDYVRERDIALRPMASPEDVLRVMPGIVIGQHAGGGKADQIFLRGFDADHGTDVAVSVDGVPNNLVSHAHGQGYADLHWLIPETLSGAETRKGPYFADQGDFGTAGALNFVTRDRFETPFASAAGGSFGTRRLLAGGSPDVGPFTSVLAAEGYLTDGPFDHPQDLRRLNLFGKLGRKTSRGGAFSLTATGYDGRWNASGQIPERAVESGLIDRFGSIDPSEGGTSHRYSLAASWSATPSAASTRQIQMFAVSYALDLFSDFTFFANDPVNGDGIEQADRRRYYGAKGTQRWVSVRGTMLFETTAGGDLRFDDADVALYHQKERVRLSTETDATVLEGGAGAFVQEEVTLNPRLRSVAGLRYDLLDFDVDSHLPAGTGTVRSGTARQGILQPKASLILSLTPQSDLFLNYGVGFHSNDARSTVVNQGGVPALPRAAGYEVGFRTRPARTGDRLDLALSAWRLDLQNEFVYVGDEGGTEVRGPSRRQGVEMEARGRLLSWLWADLDAALSRAVFRDTGDPVPLAPTRVVSGGLTLVAPHGWKGSLRARHLGSRPAIEDESFIAKGYTVLDARIACARGPLEIILDADNLTNRDFREAQFYNVSRLPGEVAPVGDIHFTPGTPRALRLGIIVRY